MNIFRTPLLVSMPGPFELVVIFFEILLLFGGKRLPEIARGLGEGIKEFKRALSGEKGHDDSKDSKKIG